MLYLPLMANAVEAPRDLESQSPFRALVASAVVFAIPLAVYLAFANRNYGWDASMFLLQMEDGTWGSLFHPHHLLYNPLVYALVQALDSVGISSSAATVAQAVNAIAGALGVLIFFRILLKLSGRIGLSAVFALLLAASMAYWEYSLEVEVYVIPVVFLLAGLLLMAEQLSRETSPRGGLFLKLGLLTACACVFHQMHVLFVPVVVTFCLLTVKANRQRVKMLAVYLAPFLVLTCGGYVAAAWVTGNLDGPVSLWQWVTTSFRQGAGWGTFSYKNFPYAAYGLFKTFFARSETRDFLVTSTIDRNGIALLGVIAATAVLLAALAMVTIGSARKLFRAHRSLVLVLAVWIVAYGAFCVWFDPYTHEFWIPLLPPVWLCIFLAIQRWMPAGGPSLLKPRLLTAVPVVLLVLLASVNFAGDILPNSDIDNNENYQLASKFNDLGVDGGDLVLIWGPVPLNNYYRLFFEEDLQVTSLGTRPREYLPEDSDTITKEQWFEAHQRLIEDAFARGGRVFISQRELTPSSRESTAFLGELRSIKIAEYPVFYAKYEDRLRPVFTYRWRSEETVMFEIEG